MVPLTNRHQPGFGLEALDTRGISDAKINAAVGVQPQRVGALAGSLAGALEDERRPSVFVAIHLGPSFQRDLAFEFQCGI